MTYPKVVALDTDWTIWQQYLDHRKWGKGPRAHAKIEDNIERVDRWLLRDRTNHHHWIRVYNDISKVVHDILKPEHGAKLAIVSRNPSKAMCDRALYYFNTINPRDNKEWSIIHLVEYDEVANETKVKPFRRILNWSESDFSDMLLFDDEAFNNSVRIKLGVTFQFVRNGKGLTWETYQQGLKAWRHAKSITIPTTPGHKSKRVLIGYSGLPTSWVELVRKGEGTVDRKTPYRWGYALYVTASMPIAKYFSNDFNGGYMHEKSHVCEVWVKDYDIWAKMNKIWVPEHSSHLPGMNNMHWTLEKTGQNQENRDRFIAHKWGVHTPYVLFSRHHWMKGMPIPRKHRWDEMVVYTQIQRSLIEVVPLSNTQLNQITNTCPFPFDRQFKSWNITAPPETRQEFWRYKEKNIYQYSS